MNHSIPNKLRLILLGCFLISHAILSAQDCDSKIDKAVISYEQGKLNDVVDLLQQCVQAENVVYRQNALRLRSMAFLGLSETSRARLDAIELLKLNPTYQPSLIDDPSDFVRLIESITVIPKFTLGVSLSVGLNWIAPRVTKVYDVTPYLRRDYIGRQGFVVGASSSYQFSEQWGAHVELVASNKRYRLEYPNSEAELSLQESLTYLSLPLSVRWIPGKFYVVKPYVEFGGYGGYLLGSQASYYSKTKAIDEAVALEQISTRNRRKSSDYGWLGSIGAMRDLGPGRVSAQVSYRHSLMNITDEATRFDYTDLARRFYHLDDNVILSNVLLEFGYQIFINYKVID